MKFSNHVCMKANAREQTEKPPDQFVQRNVLKVKVFFEDLKFVNICANCFPGKTY